MRILCGMLTLTLILVPFAFGQDASIGTRAVDSAENLRQLAQAYYAWRNENDPVGSSSQGLHTWDEKLQDYSESAIAMRRKHLAETLAQVNSMRTDSWAKDDQIDWLLFRSQIEGAVFL